MADLAQTRWDGVVAGWKAGPITGPIMGLKKEKCENVTRLATDVYCLANIEGICGSNLGLAEVLEAIIHDLGAIADNPLHIDEGTTAEIVSEAAGRRIKELERAIRVHRDSFGPNAEDTCEEDRVLWGVLRG